MAGVSARMPSEKSMPEGVAAMLTAAFGIVIAAAAATFGIGHLFGAAVR
jgi:hypothetical protein